MKLLLLLAVLIAVSSAAIFTAIKGGDWDETGVWDQAGSPMTTDTALIPADIVVNVGTATRNVANLTLFGTLQFTSSTSRLIITESGSCDVIGGKILALNLLQFSSYITKEEVGFDIRIRQDPARPNVLPQISGVSGMGWIPFSGSSEIFTQGNAGFFRLESNMIAENMGFSQTIDCQGGLRTIFVRSNIGISADVTNQGQSSSGVSNSLIFQSGANNVNYTIGSSQFMDASFQGQGQMYFSGRISNVVFSPNEVSVSSDQGAEVFLNETSFTLRPSALGGKVSGKGSLQFNPRTNVTSMTAVEYVGSPADILNIPASFPVQVNFVGASGASNLKGQFNMSTFSKRLKLQDQRGDKSSNNFVEKFFGGTSSTSGIVELIDGVVVETSKSTMSQRYTGSGTVVLSNDPVNTNVPNLLDSSGMSGASRFVPTGVTLIYKNVETKNLEGQLYAKSILPPGGFLRILVSTFPNGISFLDGSTLAGTLVFSDTAHDNQIATVRSGNLGSLIVRGSQVTIENTCSIKTAAATTTAQQGLLEFEMEGSIGTSNTVELNKCTVDPTNSSFYLKFAETILCKKRGERKARGSCGVNVPKNYDLPPIQVGTLHIKGNPRVKATGGVVITQPKLWQDQNGQPPFIATGGEFSPDLKFENSFGWFSVPTSDSTVTIMGDIDMTGSIGARLRLAGPNSKIWCSSFRPHPLATNFVDLSWGDICRGDGDFPQIIANGTFCQSGCSQPSLNYNNIIFNLDMQTVPFSSNLTFAKLDDQNCDATLGGVNFVNTGGLTYGWTKGDCVSEQRGGAIYKYSTWYLYPTSAMIPRYYGCDRTDCEQIQTATAVINTCDDNSNLEITFDTPKQVRKALRVLRLLIKNGTTVEFDEGASLTVTSNLDINKGSAVKLARFVQSTIGADLMIAGNLTLASGATMRVTGQVEFSSDSEFNIESGLNGVPIQTLARAIFNGRLIITLTIQIFQRSTVQATTVVPIASYESSSGAFQTVELADSNYTGAVCDTYSTPTTTQSSSTLSVAVDVSRDTSVAGCELTSTDGGLPLGAIIGIAVGGAALFILVFVLILVGCRKRELKKQNAMFLQNTYNKRSSAYNDDTADNNNGDGGVETL